MCFCCEEKCFQLRNTCFDHLCGNERFAFEPWSYNIYLLTALANVSVQLLEYCLGEAPRGTRALGQGLQFLPQSCAHRGRAGWQLDGSLVTARGASGSFLLPTLTSRPVWLRGLHTPSPGIQILMTQYSYVSTIVQHWFSFFYCIFFSLRTMNE